MRKLTVVLLALSALVASCRVVVPFEQAAATQPSAAAASAQRSSEEALLPTSIDVSAAMCSAELSQPEAWRATTCVTNGVLVVADIITVRYGESATHYMISKQRLDLQMTYDESHECEDFGGEPIWYPGDTAWVYCENVDK